MMDNTDVFACLNCGRKPKYPTKPDLYCSIACAQEAELIRYVRRCSKDGRIERTDVQEAIQIRLAHIVSGGYNKEERHLSSELRETVFSHYDGVCNICGSPGTDIDHILGPSNTIENLQLLCKECHNKKTMQNIEVVDINHENYDVIKDKVQNFWSRVEAENPLRSCDDDERWCVEWRSISNERKEALNKKTVPTK